MGILCIAVGLLAVYVVSWIIRLLVSDCDLTLQRIVWFGKKTECLKGKVVWITGASSGIGEFLAYELASVGCKLILSARRQAELEQVKKQCLISGPVGEDDILVLPLDLVKYDTHVKATQQVLDHFKQIDILVNNAGRSQRALFVDIELEVDRESFELNVLGTLSLTKAVLPHMLRRKSGHIVIMNSLAGKIGAPFSSSYTGAKHALQGYFDCLRTEIGDSGLTVTSICPGPVFSNILETAFTAKMGEMHKGSMKPNEKRIKTDRCAYLTAVAIANKLDEVWIAMNPFLAFTYMSQFLPAFNKRLAVRIGMKQIMKMRQA